MRYEAHIFHPGHAVKLFWARAETPGEALAKAWAAADNLMVKPEALKGWQLLDNGVVYAKGEGPAPKPNAEWLKGYKAELELHGG